MQRCLPSAGRAASGDCSLMPDPSQRGAGFFTWASALPPRIAHSRGGVNETKAHSCHIARDDDRVERRGPCSRLKLEWRSAGERPNSRSIGSA